MHSTHDPSPATTNGAQASRLRSSGVPPGDGSTTCRGETPRHRSRDGCASRVSGGNRRVRSLAVLVAAFLLTAGACTSPAAPPPGACSGADVADLPLIAVDPPARPATPARVAIILSGDGGWRSIDRSLAERLVTRGFSVVGFNTPVYFLERKSPDVAACALARVMRRAMIDHHASRVLLVGYSRGADVLPFMASRLPADLASSVDLIALLGAEKKIEFRFDPLWYPFKDKEPEYDVLPEVQKLRAHHVLCVYGEDEDESLCRVLDPALATRIVQPGGHHFGGNYEQVADAIAAAVDKLPFKTR